MADADADDGVDTADGADLLAGLEGWAAEARAREAAEARARERWLRTQASEGAHLRAVLSGMVEQGAGVTVTTVGGRAVPGRLAGLGDDFVALTLAGDRRHLVALRALAWVRPLPGASAPRRRHRREPALGPDETAGWDPDDEHGDGRPRGTTLVDVLAHAVANRPRVSIYVDGASLAGELRAVGVDVVALQTDGDPPGLAYVRLASIYEISFLDSG